MNPNLHGSEQRHVYARCRSDCSRFESANKSLSGPERPRREADKAGPLRLGPWKDRPIHQHFSFQYIPCPKPFKILGPIWSTCLRDKWNGYKSLQVLELEKLILSYYLQQD
ncbi:unnamed protein product [Nezara viridula]|uniref:Uncharacterized protein n=1 Tax=Nezara viridula TaxID=85310 RepID=A0A9P0H2Z7_NEZVI|nr:unnamed protein product [Nezara viridula]